MRRNILKSLAIAVLSFSSVAHAVDHGTGLKFASDEQLRGVPLASTPFAGADLPANVDMSNLMPPVGNQGGQNSCVAWTIAYALKSYQERVEEKSPYHLDAQGNVSGSEVFSPSYIYNQINNGKNTGVVFTDALNILSSQGVATWNDMPYDEKDFTSAPSEVAKAHAKFNRIDTWRRVNVADTNEVKAHLAAGFPVMVGAKLDEGFMAADAQFVWREVKGAEKGGHAMLVVGYDDSKKAFKLLNSWGTNWGDHGYGWVDYEFFRHVVFEAYVAKDAHKIKPAPQPTIDPTQPEQPVVIRRPDPAPVDQDQLLQQVSFRWGQMVHNIPMLGHFEVGPCLGLNGQLNVPAKIGDHGQVVMFFYYDDGNGGVGKPIRSRMRKFATAQGDAADGTDVFPIGPDGVGMNLLSIVPYAALDLPAGHAVYDQFGNSFYQPRTTAVVAIPVLFVDGFGVKTGPIQHFWVNR